MDLGEIVTPSPFSVIFADPPWPERGGGKIKRGADKHYALLEPADILRVMLQAPVWRPADDAHLYLACTMSSLPDAVAMMPWLGFRYVSNLAWVKGEPGCTDVGIGQYFRGEHEQVLFGVRGSGFAVRTADRGVRSVVFARTPREDGKRVHSRKPDTLFERIERRSSGPKLEMFGRRPREGWTVWGNDEALKEQA
jgi:N6-adenosine-specific RNA methylase IME4